MDVSPPGSMPADGGHVDWCQNQARCAHYRCAPPEALAQTAATTHEANLVSLAMCFCHGLPTPRSPTSNSIPQK